MIWLIFLFALPSVYEAWTDREGETRSQKVKDALILIAVGLLMTVLAWLFLHVQILKSIALLLAWRLLIFDYLVSYLLIRNGVIVGHWFSYNGKTAWFDRLVSRVNPVVRLAVRVIVFLAAIFFFFLPVNFHNK